MTEMFQMQFILFRKSISCAKSFASPYVTSYYNVYYKYVEFNTHSNDYMVWSLTECSLV